MVTHKLATEISDYSILNEDLANIIRLPSIKLLVSVPFSKNILWPPILYPTLSNTLTKWVACKATALACESCTAIPFTKERLAFPTEWKWRLYLPKIKG